MERSGASPRSLFGRDRELGDLRRSFEEAVSGRGHMVLVGGEPGIGKTRLVDEFVRDAERRGALILWGKAWEAGGAPPFWPFVECLRGLVETSDPGSLREALGPGASDVAQILPELRERLGDIAAPLSADPETARFRLFDAVSTFLVRAASRRPLVLVLDDLQAADEPSLLMLRFLSGRLARSRMLVVTLYRNTEVGRGGPVAELVRALSPASVRILLSGLAPDAVAGFVESVGGPEASAEVASAIHAETDGNPLFVVEVVRLLESEGSLTTRTGRSARSIPSGVRDVIDARLSRLPPGCSRLLGIASVVGREFGIEVLQHVDEGSRAELLSSLDEAVNAGVVEVEALAGVFRFSHALVRDAIYESLAPGERARLHGRVGEALEAIYGAEPGPMLAHLAHHFVASAPAGDAEKAVVYSERAAERARSVLAYEEAVRLYRMALRAHDLGDGEDLRRADLLLGLGDAEARVGDADAAREAFLRSAEIALSNGSAELLARAALGYGGRFVWEVARGDPNLRRLLEEALRLLPDGDSELRARVLARLSAGPLRDEPSGHERDRMSAEAVEIARRVRNDQTLAWVLDGRYSAVWGPDNLDERIGIARELIDVARRAGDLERELQGHHYLCLSLLESGDMEGVDREVAAQDRLADRLRQPAQRWYVEAVRTTLAIFHGRFHAAEQMIDREFEAWRRTQGTLAVAILVIHSYALRRAQGRLSEIVPRLQEAAQTFPTYIVLRCLLAHSLVETGRTAEGARVLAELGIERFGTIPRNEEWLFAMAVLADAAVLLGDGPSAEELYAQLAPFASRNAVSAPDACLGSVSRPLGNLAALAGRSQEAERHLNDALSMNRRTGADPWVAETQLDLGTLWLARDDEGTRDRAVSVLQEAAVAGRRLGMVGLVARATARLEAAGGAVAERGLRVRRTFMFTDIVGSTALVDAVGDEEWENLRAWHDRTLRSVFAEHGGEEIDHAGDGFFVVFTDAMAAAACAVEIQRRLAAHRRTHGFAPQVRVGLHTGEATADDDHYTGRAVHEAARIGALAEGGQILASSEAVAAAGIEGREPREVELKGFRDSIVVAMVPWRAAT